MFRLKYITPNIFYAKLIAQRRRSFWFTFLITLAVILFSALSILFYWSKETVNSISWLTTIWTSAASATPAKVAFTTILSLISLIFFVAFNSKRRFLKKLKKERKIFKNGYPNEITDLIFHYYIKLKKQNNKIFWFLYFFAGLGVICIIYSWIAVGICTLAGKSDQIGMVTSATWTSFQINKPDAIAFVTGVGVFVVCVVLMPFRRLLFGRKITKIENTFFDQIKENYKIIRDSINKSNRWSKITVMVILCIIGLPLYFVFKKLIVAIFRKS